MGENSRRKNCRGTALCQHASSRWIGGDRENLNCICLSKRVLWCVCGSLAPNSSKVRPRLEPEQLAREKERGHFAKRVARAWLAWVAPHAQYAGCAGKLRELWRTTITAGRAWECDQTSPSFTFFPIQHGPGSWDSSGAPPQHLPSHPSGMCKDRHGLAGCHHITRTERPSYVENHRVFVPRSRAVRRCIRIFERSEKIATWRWCRTVDGRKDTAGSPRTFPLERGNGYPAGV
jgi:hypothetical protein